MVDEDKIARDWAKHAAEVYGEGNYTASQTGARQLARQRLQRSQRQSNSAKVMRAAGSQSDFEKLISGG